MRRLARSVFQLSGVMPLTVFSILHTVLYATLATQGGLAVLPSFLASAFYVLVEFFLIWLPLAFHAAYGLWLIAKRIPLRDSKATHLSRISRVCALLAFGFIAYHFVHFRLPVLSGSLTHADVVQYVYSELSSTRGGVPLHAIVHVAGIAATAFHLGFGIYSQAWDKPPEAQDNSLLRAWVAAALGVGLFVMGSTTVIRIAAGAFLP